MGKGSHRVKPLVPPGKAPVKPGAKPVTSLKVARKLTSKFHQLLGQQQRIQNAQKDEVTKKAELAEVQKQMEEMGGRDAYQAASILSQQNAMKSARYLFKTLARFGLQPGKGDAPLRLLEIGAINSQISAVPWLNVRAIDLLSQNPAVEQRDFFAVPVGSGPGPDPAHGPALKASAGTLAAAPVTAAVKDAILAPTPSRLRHVDWAAARAAAEAAEARRLAGGGSTSSGHDDEEDEGAGSGRHARAGHKRKRQHDDDDDDGAGRGSSGHARKGRATAAPGGESRHGSSIIFLPLPDRPTAAGAAAGAGAGTSSSGASGSSDPRVYVCPHRAPPGHVPVTGGFDILVCAMVINCVPDPAARTELLVRCRDHLMPGGLLYLSLPSRCLDMSQHLTRHMFERLLTSLGFVLRDAKMTPKISFYMLQRADVVTHATDLQPLPGTAPSAGVGKRAPWLTGAGWQPSPVPASVPLASLSPKAGAAAGHGAAWKPRIVAATSEEVALLTTVLAPPLRLLSDRDMPVTGFTRTEYGQTVPKEWLIAGKTGSGAKQEHASSGPSSVPRPAIDTGASAALGSVGGEASGTRAEHKAKHKVKGKSREHAAGPRK